MQIDRRPDGLYQMFFDNGAGDRVSFIGNAAQTIIMLSRVLFQDEANETLEKQRAESKEIGNRVITDMKANRKKYVP